MGIYFSAAAAAALFAAGIASSGREWSRRFSEAIAKLLFYAAVPAIILYKVAVAPLGVLADYAVVVSASVVGALVSAAVLVPRLLHSEPRERIGAAILAAGIHNSAFLPIPLMLLLYGDAGPAALYSAIVNIIISVAAPAVIGAYSPLQRGRSLAASIARSMATYPPLYALAAAGLLRGAGVPGEALFHSLYTAGSYATLLSFYLVGETLAKTGLGVDRGVAVVAAWRLAVEPAIAIAAVRATGLSGVWLAGAVIESFMPPATMNLVLAMIYGLDRDLVAKAIGLVTPVSIVLAVAVRALIPG